MRTPQEILDKAIANWNPVAIVCAYSGGYDSLCLTHLAHTQLDTHGLPLTVWSIDTKMSADGWVDFVTNIGKQYNWNHTIHDNQKGFEAWIRFVQNMGCPYSPKGHKYTYNRLKDTSFAVCLRVHKNLYAPRTKNNKPLPSAKVLCLSGIRQSESAERQKLTNPIQRYNKSSLIFCNPIFYWQDQDIMQYRFGNDLSENPFYALNLGSGDCNCNWLHNITLREVRQVSPKLGYGNASQVDIISRDNHGYGYGEIPKKANENQIDMFNKDDLEGNCTSPFLCSNCSRSKRSDKAKAAEFVALQRGLF